MSMFDSILNHNNMIVKRVMKGDSQNAYCKHRR